MVKKRVLLDPDAPDRFKVDTDALLKIKELLERVPSPQSICLLPETKEQLDKFADQRRMVSAVILSHAGFEVEGFRVSETGLKWDTQPEVDAVLRQYVYLSHLLHMDADDVRLLFGPRNLNDMMITQFDSMPKSEVGMIIMRLARYLREGNAVCRV